AQGHHGGEEEAARREAARGVGDGLGARPPHAAAGARGWTHPRAGRGLGAGAALAAATSTELHAVVTGADVKAAAAAAAGYGAKAVHAVEGATLATTQPGPHARAVAALAQE